MGSDLYALHCSALHVRRLVLEFPYATIMPVCIFSSMHDFHSILISCCSLRRHATLGGLSVQQPLLSIQMRVRVSGRRVMDIVHLARS